MLRRIFVYICELLAPHDPPSYLESVNASSPDIQLINNNKTYLCTIPVSAGKYVDGIVPSIIDAMND